MIRLPNTGTYSLELITAQNGAQSVVSYSDATSSAYTGGTQVASITSATTTTICSTPAASTVRDVDQINIKNTYAGSHTVTVQVDANGTNFPLIVAALLTDESLNYTHGSGWQVKDANGNTKNSALSAMTSAQLAAILTDETGSGAAVFGTSPTLDRVTVSTNSATAAMTITQTGAGNAFVVEDSTSPDSTPFVITAEGNLVAGHTARFDVSPAGTGQYMLIGSFASSQIFNGSGQYTNDTAGAQYLFVKSRGASIGANTIVQSGDTLGTFNFRGADGTNYIGAASIQAFVDGTPGTNDMPGRLIFSTTVDGGSSPTERMRIASDGTTTLGGTSTAPALRVIPDPTANTRWVTITGSNGANPTIGTSGGTLALSAGALATSSTLGLGYGTGAGGTVTQITSKATGVTLNTPCGAITMNNAALAANTTVVFRLTNSVIATTDTIVIHPNFGTGAEGFSYNVWISRMLSGAVDIAVRNITAGSLSEAVVINFAIIKGATS